MGSAMRQGRLWGTAAQDWADLQELKYARYALFVLTMCRLGGTN
jgi:hypothetical protein